MTAAILTAEVMSCTSPATPVGARLIASNLTPGQASTTATINAAVASRRCSQLSSTANARRSPSKRSTVSIVDRPN